MKLSKASSLLFFHFSHVLALRTAIQNVRVFDGQLFLEPATITIEGESIGSSSLDPDSVVDGKGGYLILGLIDSHAHVNDVQALEQMTSFGVTTVLNMARKSYSTAEDLRNRPGLASWLTASIPAISPNTVHAKMQLGGDGPLVTSIDQVPEFVASAFGNGSDFYKIVAEPNGPSQEVQNLLVKTVHDKGRKVMTHASFIEAFQQAINSGADHIQHIANDQPLTPAMMSKMIIQRQTVTPTLILFEIMAKNTAVQQIPGASFSPKAYDMALQNVKALHEFGVTILAGTDAIGENILGNLPYGKTLHQELENLVKTGLTPAEAIRAATSTAARAHGLGDRGVIEQGKRADIILLDANPLVDISNTQRISKIWVGGTLFQRQSNNTLNGRTVGSEVESEISSSQGLGCAMLHGL